MADNIPQDAATAEQKVKDVAAKATHFADVAQATIQQAEGRVGEKVEQLKRYEGVHPVLAIVIAILCGVPVGVLLAWIPPLNSISRAVLGIGH